MWTSARVGGGNNFIVVKRFVPSKYMPYIVYGGVKYIQIRHAIQCKRCLDTIESKHVHDFIFCSCKAVGIDGGVSSGNRILGNADDIEYRGMYCAVVNKKIWLPQHVIEEHFRQVKNEVCSS
uniref:DUF7695 domain-containing protein n=1 Tax=viral metagenome TaxID=1070528 RepID=A0A6C0L7N0_9ZZZZ